MRYREVCYDILTSLKKTKDDSSVELYHVLYWVTVFANKYNRFTFENTTTSGGNAKMLATNDSGLFLTTFPSVSVQTDTALHNRKYIELPAQIFDLPNERAVRYITYNHDLCDCAGANFGMVNFEPTTPVKAHVLYKSAFTKPSPKTPYFYRTQNKLYFLGLESVSVSDVEIGLFTAIDPSEVVSLDEHIPMPDEYVPDLIKEVLNLGRFLSMVPDNRVNTGNDEVDSAPLVRNVAQQQQQQNNA